MGRVQTKLEIGPADDKFEREADGVAEQVMRMPDEPVARTEAAPPTIQRTCSQCEEDRAQRKCAACEEAQVPERIEGLRGGGKPLSADLRAFFEPRFGRDFGDVRVHTGKQAAETAAAINARAFTVGRDVAFAESEFAPGSRAGKRLLAHELTHVVQQRGRPAAAAPPGRIQRQAAGGAQARQDREDLGRVVGIRFTPVPQDIQRGSDNGKLFANGKIFVEASAKLRPGRRPANQFSFGFIQICRPYDVARATYRKRGAQEGSGNDLDWTATMKIRRGKQGGASKRSPLPALDVSAGHRFSKATPATLRDIVTKANPPSPVQSVKAKNGEVPALTFSDRPQQIFYESKIKGSSVYDITAFSWHSFFFLAYVVKLPSGKIEPLRTFFWTARDCMEDAWKIAGTGIKRSVGRVETTPVRNCSRHHCDRREPGFDQAGKVPPGKDTCSAINKAAQNATPYEGPSNYRLNCPS